MGGAKVSRGTGHEGPQQPKKRCARRPQPARGGAFPFCVNCRWVAAAIANSRSRDEGAKRQTNSRGDPTAETPRCSQGGGMSALNSCDLATRWRRKWSLADWLSANGIRHWHSRSQVILCLLALDRLTTHCTAGSWPLQSRFLRRVSSHEDEGTPKPQSRTRGKWPGIKRVWN
jgi:hypothetical protein